MERLLIVAKSVPIPATETGRVAEPVKRMPAAPGGTVAAVRNSTVAAPVPAGAPLPGERGRPMRFAMAPPPS